MERGRVHGKARPRQARRPLPLPRSQETDADGNPATFEGLRKVISLTLTQIITVNWEPESGANQLEATVTQVVSRKKAAMRRKEDEAELVRQATRKLEAAERRKSSRFHRKHGNLPAANLPAPEAQVGPAAAQKEVWAPVSV